MNHVIRNTAAALILTSCVGNLPEPGHPEAQPEGEVSVRPMLRPSHSPPTNSPVIDEARVEAINALQACDTVLVAIPNQQLSVKRIAYNRKQGGVLVTTLVGVAGGIATAVIAGGKQVDGAGNIDNKPAVITGVSAAGGTAVAGVISLFIVGSGADERVALLTRYAEQIEAGESTVKGHCDQVTEETAAVCKGEATRLRMQCATIEGQLPYTIPTRTMAHPTP
jgi:hypothetical protein